MRDTRSGDQRYLSHTIDTTARSACFTLVHDNPHQPLAVRASSAKIVTGLVAHTEERKPERQWCGRTW